MDELEVLHADQIFWMFMKWNRQNLGRALCTRKTIWSPPTPPPRCYLLFTVPKRCSMFVRFIFVFDFVFIWFCITWWLSVGRELSSWPSARDVLILFRLICICSFHVRCLGQDVGFDCIGSWSSPFRLLWINMRPKSKVKNTKQHKIRTTPGALERSVA